MSFLSYADWLSNVSNFNCSYVDNERMVYVETPARLEVVNQAKSLNNILIGRNTYKLPGGLLSPNVIIGRYCSISSNVYIGLTNHHMDYLSTGITNKDFITDISIQPLKDFTNIGCDVWIGAGAIILNGVKIGHGAVIGAGSVVTKDIPAYGIAVGNPARVIKYRFPDDIIEDLLKLQWWTLPAELIDKLPIDNVKACIELLKY